MDIKQKLSVLQSTYKEKQNILRNKLYEYKGNDKKIVPEDKRKGNYIFSEDDTSIPPNWKSCRFLPNGEACEPGKKVGIFPTIYVAPNGRMCRSRRDALCYMTKKLMSSESDITLMSKGLIQDGWIKINIIEGWFMKRHATTTKKT